jgi:hypothetical protein
VTPSEATGTIEFFDGAVALGSAPLAGGSASIWAADLSAGAHTITAAYGGSTEYEPTSSAPLLQNVNRASSVALACSANPSLPGQTVALTVKVTPPEATGTVQFSDDATLLGSAPVIGGSASISVVLSPGSHEITAVYSGDALHVPSTSAPFVQIVKQPTTVKVTASPSPSSPGQAVRLTAAVSPAEATGSVEFLDGATVLGAAILSGGSASLSVVFPVAGSHTISAAYSGSPAFLSSTAPPFLHTVTSERQQTTTRLVSSLNPSVHGMAIVLTATVTPPTATGSVQFFDGASPIGTAMLAAGSASISIASLPAGLRALTAAYGGDAGHAASVSPAVPQVIRYATVTTLETSSNPSDQFQRVTFTARVSPPTATGTLRFYDGSTLLATLPVSGGAAQYSTSSLGRGNHPLVVAYGGDAAHASSVSPALVQVVTWPNQLANPGFERGTTGWAGFNGTTVKVDTTVRYSGTASAKFTAGSSRRLSQQAVRVYSGVWYEFRVAARTQGVKTVAEVQWLNSAGTVLGTFMLSPLGTYQGWTTVTRTFEAPRYSYTAKIRIGAETGAGTVWFDDISFRAN